MKYVFNLFSRRILTNSEAALTKSYMRAYYIMNDIPFIVCILLSQASVAMMSMHQMKHRDFYACNTWFAMR